MKKTILFSLFVSILLSFKSEYQKPQYTNEAFIIINNETKEMAKESGKFGLAGFGVYQYKLDLTGPKSPLQISKDSIQQLKFIVKVPSQEINPDTYLTVMRFELKKKNKLRRIMSEPVASPYHADTDGDFNLDVGQEFSFKSEKYEDDYVIITLQNPGIGEYTLFNANKTNSFYTFGIY